MERVVRKLGSILYTTYLFNQYDIMSTISPVIVVGSVLAGIPDAESFFHGVIWQELHLIAFEIQNQITGIEEDKLSKPTRPLVSGRVTVQTAQRIYLALIVLSLWNSASQGVLAPSILHLISMFAYNELGFSRYWALKSFIGSMGYVCYCWAVVLSGLIFTTTGHAQDFRDRKGDAAIGRKTLAIILPQTFARWSLMALMFGWSAGLIYLWGPPAVVSVFFFGLAVYTSVNFVRDYSEEADRVSYWWYNIWLIVAHMLPLFTRLTESRVRIEISL